MTRQIGLLRTPQLFCEISIEEVRAGNRPNGIMTNQGYKNICTKYFQRTGLRHSKTQVKNKWDLLKGLYSFWLSLNKDTGLGWNPAKRTVDASDEHWKCMTKVIKTSCLLYALFIIQQILKGFLFFFSRDMLIGRS